jgi:RHS repeat-associated protein
MRRLFRRNVSINCEPEFQSQIPAYLIALLGPLLLLCILLSSLPAQAQSCGGPSDCPGILSYAEIPIDDVCATAASEQYSGIPNVNTGCLGAVPADTPGELLGGVACCSVQFQENLCACPPPNPPTTLVPVPGGSNGCGDPVDPGSGVFTYDHTDLALSDVIPIQLARSYRELDTHSRAFGIGMVLSYDLEIETDPSGNYSYVDLVLPNGARLHYPRISPGSDFLDGVYQHTSSPTIYFGSTISWNGSAWMLARKDGTQMTFAIEAMLTSIKDRNENVVQIQRARQLPNGSYNYNATMIASPNGRWISLSYDSSGRVERAQDNAGRTVWYLYDSGGHLSKVYDANGGLTKYDYDSAGRMYSFTTPNGNVHAKNQYDPNGRVVGQTQPDGGTFSFNYTLDENGNVTATDMVDPRQYTCHMTFNSNDYLISDTWAVGKPEEQEITYSRDSYTNLVNSTLDALNRTTAYTYDSQANLTSITRLSGTSQAVTTSFTYGQDSQLASVIDPLGHTWTLSLDGYGNVTGITDPLQHVTTVVPNSAGQVQSITDAARDTISFGYINGVLSSIVDGLGNTYQIVSDGVGRTTRVIDPLGNGTSYSYDLLDDLTQIVQATGAVTSLVYDGDRNLTSVSDANGAATLYSYDSMDRRILRTDPLQAAESYVYDGNGNLTSHTDRRSKITVYHYDGLNRPIFAGFGQNGNSYESTISYGWDGGDRLTSAIDSIAGTITRVPDLLDRITSESTPQGSISYSYDNANRRQTMQVAGEPQEVYGWDDANRLTGITQGSSAVGINYDNANRRTSLTLPNGVTVAYSVDSDSHITGLTYSEGNSQLGNLTYGYDADGRVTSKGGTLAATGLPTSVSGNTFNADNTMTGFDRTTLSYDLNGNLSGDGTNTYTWDARNHLSAISGSTTANFVYDAFGRRASKTVGGVTTQFLYDGLNPVQELNGANPPVASANLLTGLRIDEYFSRTDSSGTMTFLRDALGSTIGLVNPAGGIATTYTYEPFGNTTTNGANANPYQFTGRENDGNGLYFYRSRYYIPTLQRFIEQDQVGFRGGDSNLYAYVRNAAPNLIDPLGMCPCAPSGDAMSPSYYQQLGSELAPWTFATELEALEFGRGGGLDAQALGASADYANYVFGVYMAASGYSLNFTLSAGNAYAAGFSHYRPNIPMDPNYPSTPAANVAAITKGFNDEQNGTLCTQVQSNIQN